MKGFQRLFYQVTMVLLFCAVSAFAQGPAIFFTDLESGPKTGGQNNKGAFITIYGNNFGVTRGASTVTVGGGVVDNCPVWGTTWLWYQKITCQLGAKATTGDIVVTVNGIASNTLPFRVRSGKIYFVDINTGKNSNQGSVGSPWKDLSYAKNVMVNGDIAYLRAGTWSAEENYGSVLWLSGNSGASGVPKAMVGYPGETATIACDRSGVQCIDIRAGMGSSAWWVFAELDLGGTVRTQYSISWDNGAGGDGLRFVGNKIHGSLATAVVMQGPMDGNFFLGNNVYNYWSIAHGANTNERGYGIYYGGYGTQQNINVFYNRFWNDQGSNGKSTKGLQIYAHCPNDCPGIYDYFKYVTVANNQFLDNCMQGAVIGGTDGGTIPWDGSGTMYFYNNVVAGNGSCDTINNLTYSGLQIGDGYGGMHAKIWNNTFYLNAGGSLGHQGAGDIYMFKKSTESFDVSNNIFYAQPTGQIYTNFIYEEVGGTTPTLSGSNNLFFSNGNSNVVAPNWASKTVSTANPKFVAPALNTTTADFHLQPTSPARNAGATIGLVNRDIAGTARPQERAYDVGAYEFASAISATTALKPHAAISRPGDICETCAITVSVVGKAATDGTR